MRAIDTATNYQRFHAHTALARAAGELLCEFEISTKVGYFPNPTGSGPPVHSLDPDRLRGAIERATDELGQPPQTVLLHNPEVTLAGRSAAEGHDLLAAACSALAEAAAEGWCTTWGIATWDPRPVCHALGQDQEPPDSVLRPGVLMLRAGLTVAHRILEAGEQLAHQLGVGEGGRWGMSPFAGSTTDAVWQNLDLRSFLPADRRSSGAPGTAPLAFRAAFELPAVSRVAVGTTSAAHLAELVDAATLSIDAAALGRYRQLITRAAG